MTHQNSPVTESLAASRKRDPAILCCLKQPRTGSRVRVHWRRREIWFSGPAESSDSRGWWSHQGGSDLERDDGSDQQEIKVNMKSELGCDQS